MDLTDPTVIVTDMERGLMTAIENEFPTTNHLLCLWHINKNVLTNCKRNFDTKEEWDTFFAEWNALIYAHSEGLFNELWEQFAVKYRSNDVVEYLDITYITHAHRFVKCFTNRVLHFDTTSTSRGEGAHAMLKRHLGTSSGDLKTVVDAISLLLTNEYHDYQIKLNEDKIRYPLELRKPIFQQLSPYVSTEAIRRINTQYQLLTDQPTALPSCTNTFTTSTGLPCSHQIQERLYGQGSLILEDVHSHWWFDKNPPPRRNNLLLVEEPDIVRPRGRPPGAKTEEPRLSVLQPTASPLDLNGLSWRQLRIMRKCHRKWSGSFNGRTLPQEEGGADGQKELGDLNKVQELSLLKTEI